MRSATVGLFSLTLLLLAPGATAADASTGPFAGTVAEGETDHHRFDTHGDQPCLTIYIPKLYVVTLTYAPGTDALALGAHGQSAVGENGVAVLRFVDNYCTAFTISVEGVEVDREAAYAVAVESVFTGGAVVEPAGASAAAPCTLLPDPYDCVDYVDRRGEDLTYPFVCERVDMLPGIRQC